MYLYITAPYIFYVTLPIHTLIITEPTMRAIQDKPSLIAFDNSSFSVKDM